MNYVASNLKSLRKQTGLSQDQFAVRLDLNRGNIASYEKGSAEPSIEKIVKFAAFFRSMSLLIQKDLSGAAINTMPGMMVLNLPHEWSHRHSGNFSKAMRLLAVTNCAKTSITSRNP